MGEGYPVGGGRYVHRDVRHVFGRGGKCLSWVRDAPEPVGGSGAVSGEDGLVVRADCNFILVEDNVTTSVAQLPDGQEGTTA